MLIIPDKRYTFADVLIWPEDAHIELIEGVPYQLPRRSRIHQEICQKLGLSLWKYMEDKLGEVFFMPLSTRLFEKDGDTPEGVDTYVEPDIIVICDPSKLDDIGCKGAPDLIIEILSPSSKRHDMVTKFNLYRRAGVREYWIVDPDGKTVQTYILENGYYIAGDLASPGDKLPVNVLDGCVVDLAQLFD